MNTETIKEILGKTATDIRRDDDSITFAFSDGSEYKMHHIQDCCESVTIEDICGGLDDLVGCPLEVAEERESERDENGNPHEYESATWTFYHFATNKGWVTIRWFGHSNGYYSERVDFERIKTPRNHN